MIVFCGFRNSFSRPPIISPTNKKKKGGVFGSLRQYSFAKESKDPGEKSTRHSALTISDRREEKKGQKWYESIFEVPPSDKPPNAPKAGKRKSSTKRHTICGKALTGAIDCFTKQTMRVFLLFSPGDLYSEGLPDSSKDPKNFCAFFHTKMLVEHLSTCLNHG